MAATGVPCLPAFMAVGCTSGRASGRAGRLPNACWARPAWPLVGCPESQSVVLLHVFRCLIVVVAWGHASLHLAGLQRAADLVPAIPEPTVGGGCQACHAAARTVLLRMLCWPASPVRLALTQEALIPRPRAWWLSANAPCLFLWACVFVRCRYEGTDVPVMTPAPSSGDYAAAFEEAYQVGTLHKQGFVHGQALQLPGRWCPRAAGTVRAAAARPRPSHTTRAAPGVQREFGFKLEGRSILVDDVRVRACGRHSELPETAEAPSDAGGYDWVTPEANPRRTLCALGGRCGGCTQPTRCRLLPCEAWLLLPVPCPAPCRPAAAAGRNLFCLL